MQIKKAAKRLLVAAVSASIIGGACATAKPAAIAGDTTTYSYRGRTRVNLPQDIVDDINDWVGTYTANLKLWSAEDGPKYNAYYGGLEEGFNYGVQTLLARLGYLDGTGEAANQKATLESVPNGWDDTYVGELFFEWECKSFGELS